MGAQRASAPDRILDRPPITSQALVGVGNIASEDRLALKLKKRKNLRRVSALAMPCFGSANIVGGSGFCQIRDFWPAIRLSSPIGASDSNF